VAAVLEMAESSPTRHGHENKIAERFGGQPELDLVMPKTRRFPSRFPMKKSRKVPPKSGDRIGLEGRR
jgi:hypothetical protein